LKALLTGSVLTSAVMAAAPGNAMSTSLEMQILFDVSGNVSDVEFADVKAAFAAAFRSDTLKDTISASPTGSIAVSSILWAGRFEQRVSVPWTVVTAGTSDLFARSLEDMIRPFSGETAVQRAISFAVMDPAADYRQNDFQSTNQVMLIASDGDCSRGKCSPVVGRDVAIAAGIDVIDAVVFGDDADQSAFNYFLSSVVASTLPGAGTVTTASSTSGAFGTQLSINLDDLVANSLLGLIKTSVAPAPVPLPAAAWLFAGGLLGLGGVAGWRRRR